MKHTKVVDFGEYIITINYNETNSSLEVIVSDETGVLIESMDIKNSEDKSDLDINLN